MVKLMGAVVLLSAQGEGNAADKAFARMEERLSKAKTVQFTY